MSETTPNCVGQQYRYKTYGLRIESEIALPELLQDDATTTADVRIRRQKLPPALNGQNSARLWFQQADSVCQFHFKDIARFRIEQGRQILVDPANNAAPGDIRLYLLGTVLGALLYQRNQLPLHVSSVLTQSGLWAFTGNSGDGKSTLAAELHLRQGYPLFSDDVAVVDDDNGELLMHPGPPRLKLWEDALEHFAIGKEDLVPDLTRHHKYHLQLQEKFCTKPQKLHGIVFLERSPPGELADLTRIKGTEAFQLLLSGAIYRPLLGHRIGDPTQQFRTFSNLLKQVEVYRYRRPWSLSALDGSLRPLLEAIDRSNSSTKYAG